jgi:hypothetical protein
VVRRPIVFRSRLHWMIAKSTTRRPGTPLGPSFHLHRSPLAPVYPVLHRPTLFRPHPEPVNILTALAENESVVKKESDPERRAIALAWLFHLVGDIHQLLHTAQIFTVDYANGDRGGNEICVRVTQAGQPMDLHRFWDGVITSSSNLTRLRNDATALRNRQEFQRGQLTELANTDFESWAKESFEIATILDPRKVGNWILTSCLFGLPVFRL